MKTMLTVLALGMLTACQPNSSTAEKETTTELKQAASVVAKAQTESERLNQWFAVKYEEELQMSPMMLTFLGRKEKYDQVDDMTLAAEKKRFAWQKKYRIVKQPI